MAVDPGPVSTNVWALIVLDCIAWLKVAVTTLFGQTPVAPAAARTEVTVGGGWHEFAAVVKLQTSLFASELP